jgi:hypothetical protein
MASGGPRSRKSCLEGGDGGIFARGFERFAVQQKSRGVVGDGQRIAIACVAEFELALEVGAPKRVGGIAPGQRRPRGAAARTAQGLDQIVAAQSRVDGALDGNRKITVELAHRMA